MQPRKHSGPLQLWSAARAVPETQNENRVGIMVKLVNDAIGAVNNLTNGGIIDLENDAPHLGLRADEQRAVDSIPDRTSRRAADHRAR